MELKHKNLNTPITIVSIAIPVVVALLFYLPRPNLHLGFNVHILPLFHAVLNGSTAVLLLASLYFIKNGHVRAHKITNLIAISLSSVFLVSYVIYHAVAPETRYGDLNHDAVVDAAEQAAAGATRFVYYFILITHIILAGIIVPLVLFTTVRAFQDNLEGHRRLARITWPVWFYIAVTGVVVYVMLSPYY